VKLAVSPPSAVVDVDGVVTPVEGGSVAIKGAAGSAHIVHVVSGKQEATYPVLLTDSGVVPRRVALTAAPPAAPKPPREPAHDKPAPPAPAPAAPAPSSDPPAARNME
jgi:hypothetical protein